MALDPLTPTSLMEGYQLFDDDHNKQVSDSHVEELTRTHCGKWRYLPPHLGLDNTMKDDIDREYGSEREKRYNFFIEWKERKGADATYKSLISGLLKSGCRSDAEYVCQLMKQGKQQPLPPESCLADSIQTTNCDAVESSSSADTQETPVVKDRFHTAPIQTASVAEKPPGTAPTLTISTTAEPTPTEPSSTQTAIEPPSTVPAEPTSAVADPASTTTPTIQTATISEEPFGNQTTETAPIHIPSGLLIAIKLTLDNV